LAINPNCTVIGVIGGKGGVGKSVVAANLSCAFLAELRTQVLLIDADSKSVGDQNVILGLKPQKTLKELATMTASLNSVPINQIVTPHASGLHYIGAVRGPDERLDVSPELVSKLLEFLSRQYKFIIVDLGNDVTPLQHSILMEATAAIVVTTPELLVVTQTQRLMNDLFSATFPKDMFQLVVNKYSPQGINPQAISNQLLMPPVGIIPQDDITSNGSIQKFAPFVLTAPKAPVSQAHIDIVRKLTGGILQRLKSLSRPKSQTPAPAASNGSSAPVVSTAGLDPITQIKLRVHSELIRTADLNKLLKEIRDDESKQSELREKTKREITQIVDKEAPELSREERARVIKEVLEESLGLGPLEDLLANDDIKEIMVNGAKKIFVDRTGGISLSNYTFTSNDHLRRIIERIVTPLGRQINNAVPYVDARLKDGSRVNAVIEPLALDGPALTIRKFPKKAMTAQDLINVGALNKQMADFLRICVENGINIVVSGGTGSGKTTLLNVLSSFIPARERVITVEDAAELRLQQEHVVRLETRPSSMEGSNAVTIRDLIKNALRMRPDRIIVGECRDGAALDMLQAMNTGHDGSMTTTHANTPRECISRIETLVMMAGMDLPVKAIRDQIASAVNIIVQVNRLSDDSRKIVCISEVGPIQGEYPTLADIYEFKPTGFDRNRKVEGSFKFNGNVPRFVQKLKDRGVNIPQDLFSNDVKAEPAKTAASTPVKKSS
jgi:septum site-determining protein MinD